jgi:hypothetical protein
VGTLTLSLSTVGKVMRRLRAPACRSVLEALIRLTMHDTHGPGTRISTRSLSATLDCGEGGVAIKEDVCTKRSGS